MSAISGILHFDGRSAERQDLFRLAEALRHRGPQGVQYWSGGAVGFVAALGSTVRQRAALIEERGPLTVVANSRLDNREDLEAALLVEPGELDVSDGQIILRAYERWGGQCVTHLVGDFAFALWDASRQRLFCGRDYLGLKPFYYCLTRTGFAFASEIKALLALPGVPRDLDEARIADYVMQMHEDPEATFYRGLRRLRAAHSLTVDARGHAASIRYLAIDPQHEIRYADDASYAEAYREHFIEAVRCRMRGGLAVGSMLSGGFDSSSITCVARNMLAPAADEPLKTFSLVFDSVRAADERPFIGAVVKQGGLEPHYVNCDGLHPLQHLDEMLRCLDEPFITPNLFLYWELYRHARNAGIGIMLDGLTGDSVVSHGTRYLTELAATGRWLELAKQIRTISRVLGTGRRAAYPYLLRDFVIAPIFGEALLRARAAVVRPVLPSQPQSRFINFDFAREIRWIERAREFRKDVPRTPFSARAEQYGEVHSGSFPLAFEVIDKGAAAFGLTTRLPYTDRRLLEYCLAVPAAQKSRDGWTRAYARRAMRDVLPEEVGMRYGKQYLGAVLRRALFEVGRTEVEELVMERLSVAARYVDVRAVQSACREAFESPRDSPLVVTGCVLPILVLARWLEMEQAGSTAREHPRAGAAVEVRPSSLASSAAESAA